MKNLGQLLNSLVTKAGLDINVEDIKSLLSNADITRINVPDDISNALENNLLTMDSAKANLTLKKHFDAQALNGVDGALKTAMDEMGLDDDFKTKILAETSTPKRAAMLAKEVRELEKSKASASNTGDKKALQDQINALNAEKANLVTSHKAELDNVRAQADGNITDLLVKNTLSGYEYALGDLPKEVQVQTANNLIQNEMTAKGVKLVNENGNLKLVTKEGTEYYEANKPVSYKDFVSQTLGSNKLLKTATSAQNGNTSSGGQQKTIEPGSGQGAMRTETKFISELDAQLSNLMK
jgi:hypothetical protein